MNLTFDIKGWESRRWLWCKGPFNWVRHQIMDWEGKTIYPPVIPCDILDNGGHCKSIKAGASLSKPPQHIWAGGQSEAHRGEVSVPMEMGTLFYSIIEILQYLTMDSVDSIRFPIKLKSLSTCFYGYLHIFCCLKTLENNCLLLSALVRLLLRLQPRQRL